MHAAFDELLKTIVAKKEALELYQRILKSFFSQTNEERITQIQRLQAEIDQNKARVNKAMQMMLDGEIESSEYKGIKSKFDGQFNFIARSGITGDKQGGLLFKGQWMF